MNAEDIMANELEKTFFDTFGIRAYYKYLLIDKTSRCHNEKLFDKINFIDFIKSGKDYLLLKVIKYHPQITDHILLELICLNNIYLWETHTSTVNELKNVLLNKYIEHVNLMADENEKQEYINQVRTLFKEGR